MREFVIHQTGQGVGRGLVGTPISVADELAVYVERHAVDGFNITPWLVPGGNDDIVNDLVPELQNRGLYRTEYEGETLRHVFGIPADSPSFSRVPVGVA